MPIFACSKERAHAFLPKRTDVLYCLGETLRSKKPSSWPKRKKTQWPRGALTKIDNKGFDVAIERKRLLDAGTIKYRADDRLYRKDQVAINCLGHSMRMRR
jgi:hypothetical protein